MNRQEEKARKSLKRARVQLLVDHPFFGVLATQLEPEPFESPPWTAGLGIDGKRLYFDPEKIVEMPEKALQGSLAHEALHCALGHPWRREEKNKKRWNVACIRPTTIIPGEFEKIKNICKGDKAFGLSGANAVTQTFEREYNGDMIQIKAVNLLPFQVTPEHPVLACRRKQTWRKKGDSAYEITEPKWVEPTELDEDHYLLVPRLKGKYSLGKLELDQFIDTETKVNGHSQAHNVSKKIRDGLQLNKDTAWLMGFYVAEGSSGGSNAISFAMNPDKKELVKRVLEINRKYLGYSHSFSERSLMLSSTVLRRAFAHYFGRGACNKQIPEFILLHEDTEIIEQFLYGYLQGDGSWSDRDECWTASTVSRTLAMQLQLLITRLGSLPTAYKWHHSPRKLRGRKLPSEEAYRVIWRPKGIKTSEREL